MPEVLTTKVSPRQPVAFLKGKDRAEEKERGIPFPRGSCRSPILSSALPYRHPHGLSAGGQGGTAQPQGTESNREAKDEQTIGAFSSPTNGGEYITIRSHPSTENLESTASTSP